MALATPSGSGRPIFDATVAILVARPALPLSQENITALNESLTEIFKKENHSSSGSNEAKGEPRARAI
jgi:hypothetical protein